MASKREIFARNFRAAFEKSHLNQVQLGDICFVSKATVNDWLNGRTIPRLEKVSMIANALGVTERDLLTGLDDQNERMYENREIAELARELYSDPESRSLYEEISRLTPENKQALKQIVRTMNLSQKN